MEECAVVTCFLRNDGEVLLGRRSEAVGSYPGRWAAISGHSEGNPDAAARREIAEETGLGNAVTLIRRGDPFDVVDDDRDTRWTVHPYLFDCERRDVDPNWEIDAHEWVPPTEILRRETVPDLWRSYDRVRPTVGTIRADRDHGSAWLSIRALEVLRDQAGLAAWGDPTEIRDLPTLARALRDARPGMAVVANRINRVMSRADGTPESVEATARDVIESACNAADAVAAAAAERLPDAIATLSRSGTVLAAIERADPESVLVATSRPGGEGVEVAAAMADEHDVTLAPDATLAWALHQRDVEAVVVGADAIGPDGAVCNKVGTRAAALAADREGIDLLVVASVDKVDPTGDFDTGSVDPTSVYDGSAPLSIDDALFDVTPPDLIDTIVTGRGVFEPGEIGALAVEHRDRAGWDG